MIPSRELVDFVAGWEGRNGLPVLSAYLDSVGVPTIGYGHTQGVAMGDTCTTQQALAWLEEEINSTAKVVAAFMKRTPEQWQFDALTSLAYNCGAARIGESGVMMRFNAGNDEDCADRMQWWNKAGGRVIPGLVKRRAAEADIYLRADYSGRP